ncbi:MAG: TRZ/ATZ family hydrolase [bacterium]
MQVDTLIHARWIAPVRPRKLLENHSIAIKNGKIVEIAPRETASRKYQATTVQECGDHLITPGFINAHTHAAMNLFRGMADDLPLMEWLQEHIWPAEARWLSEQFVLDGSQLAIAEMLRSGTTCFNDMYLFPDVTARAAQQSGIRATIGLVVIDFPTPWAENAEEYLRKGLDLRDEFKDDGLIRTALAPHAPYTVSEDPLKEIAMLGNELDIPIHIHLHETAAEVAQSVEQHSARPLKRLEGLGMLTPNLCAVHMTQLTSEEIKSLAKHKASVIHCPSSNLKLASGFCPAAQLKAHHVNVALGTDGAASNNDLNMLSEMRIAALAAKGSTGEATRLKAHDVLEMATINGARALHIDHETGTLEKGKSADITAIRMDTLETLPITNPVSQLVYSSSREAIEHVWVAGKPLLHHRQLTTLDEPALIETAKRWQAKISDQAHA